nr:MAG TPA: hypothetical protein [Siphoviridae sp. ctoof1]
MRLLTLASICLHLLASLALIAVVLRSNFIRPSQFITALIHG